MSSVNDLLTQILERAKQKGLKQKELAERAGISAETLSRAKKAGDMHLSSLHKLASIVDLKLCFCPAEPIIERINSGSMFE